MCRMLGVSSSGYYDYLKRGSTVRESADEQLLTLIKGVFKKSRETYGYRRITRQLAREGVHVNEKRVRRVMRINGLEGRVRRLRRRLHMLEAEGVHAPDLVLRDWNPTHPTSCGSLTSPTSAPGKAGSTSR